MMILLKTKFISDQSGSLFFYVFLGVALFAALAYIVTRDFKSSSVNMLSDRQAEIVASEITNYGQSVIRAVDRLRRKGVSENDICFYHPNWGHVTYNGCSADTENQVFHKLGGGAIFRKMHEDWLDRSIPATYGEYGNIMYTGWDAVSGVGTDGSDISNKELLMVFPYVPEKVCKFINKSLGLSSDTIPDGVTGFHPAASGKRFTGSFMDGSWSSLYVDSVAGFEGELSACVARANYYVFYNVLIAR